MKPGDSKTLNKHHAMTRTPEKHKRLIACGILSLLSLAGYEGPFAQPLPVITDALDVPTATSVWPPISVFRLKSPVALREACEAFNARFGQSQCSVNPLAYDKIHGAINASGSFATVSQGQKDEAYALAIASILYPASATHAARVDVVAEVYWYDQKLAVLEYQLPYLESDITPPPNEHPGKKPATKNRDIYARLATALIKNFDQQDIFSKATLHQTLQSSNYEETLSVEPTIGEFTHRQMTVLRNPAYGASLRYEHNVYHDAYLDVFIYPVLEWAYEEPSLLNEELSKIRDDLHKLEQQGLWQKLSLGPTAETMLLPTRSPQPQQPLDPSSTRVLGFAGEYRDQQAQLFSTTTHLYRAGDKFVKVRASFPKFAPVESAVGAFVRDLQRTLEVPDASPFMDRLRQAWEARAVNQ